MKKYLNEEILCLCIYLNINQLNTITEYYIILNIIKSVYHFMYFKINDNNGNNVINLLLGHK